MEPTLSREALNLAQQRMRVEFAARSEAFANETRRIAEEFSVRNTFHSSMHIWAVRRLIKQEYDIRALIAWQILSRIISAESVPSTPELVRLAKAEVANALEAFCVDLRQADDKAVHLMAGGNWPDHYSLKELAVARVESEIDIALFAVRNTASQAATSSITIINPVGIVQTGAGATATLTQTFGPSEREAVERALAAIRSDLERSTELPEPQRSEVLAVVADAEAEVRAAKPNMTRLRGALSVVAATVQTLGSVRAAYELLKGAALLVGVQLP